MNEIRVVWNIIGRKDLVGTSIQAGLWHPKTPDNLKTLCIMMESSNEAYRLGSH